MDRRLLNKLKFHLARLLQQPDSADWEQVLGVLDGLAGQSPDAATVALHKLLETDAPVLRQRLLPADARRLLHELTVATRREATAPARPMSVEERVAGALRGRALLVIGGDPRKQHAERLRSTFGLSELIWPVTREDAPDLYSLEPVIARADVAAVVLLIRFIRHALNDVDDLCTRHSKPLARCTAGYNPAQVATALVEQCGKRLGL